MKTVVIDGKQYPEHPPPGRLMPPDPQRLKRLMEALQCAMAMVVPAERVIWRDLLYVMERVEAKRTGMRPLDLDTPDALWLSTSDGRGS